MDKIKPILWSLIKSSQDPNKVSLFLKGLVGTLSLLGILKLEIDNTNIDAAVPLIVAVVTGAVGAVSAVVSLWGLVRKFL